MKTKSIKQYFDNKEKSCREYQKTFGDYIEEKLSIEDEHLLVLHVKRCKECMEELEATYMFASAFKFLEDNNDEGIRTDIKDLLRRSEEEYNYVKRHRITLIVGIITTTVLIGLIVVFFLNTDIREMFLWGK